MFPEPTMTILFALYALPFFMLWTVIAVFTKKDSKFTISKTLWLIAGFGLIHGIHEWTEFFELQFNLPLNPIDAVSLAISYYFLIQFGISTLVISAKRNTLLHLIALAPLIFWFLLVIRTPHEFMATEIGDVYARYSLGVLGCFLTSLVLFKQRAEFRKTGQPGIVRSLYQTSGGFLIYGLFSGLIVPDVGLFPTYLNYTRFYQVTGVPVQAFRTVIIIFIGFAVIRLLRIFEWEKMSSIISAKEELERKVEEHTAALAEANQKLKLLIETEPECVKLLSADGSVIQMNRAGLALIDAETEDQILGKDLNAMIDERHRPAFQDLTTRVFRGESGSLEFEIVGLKGRRLWLETHAAPLRNERNEIVALLGITRDITARKQAETALQQREKQLAESQHIAHVGSWERNLATGVMFWSDELFRIFRLDPETDRVDFEMFFDMIHPDDRSSLQKAIDETIRFNKPYSNDYRIVLRDGTTRFIHAQADLKRDEAGQALLRGTAQDITERKLAEVKVQQSEAKYRNLFESSMDGIFILELDGTFIDVNNTAYTRLGYTKDELLALHISKLDPPEFARRVPERLNQILEHGFAVFESAHLRRDGTAMPVEINSRLIEYERRPAYLSVIRDITERKKMEEEIRHMAHHDALTGLPNRTLFTDIFKIESAQARRARKKLAILFLDLDRFKEINDTLGHDAGDQLLKEVSGRITGSVRESDSVARVGGDEFNMILADLTKVEDAAEVAHKIVGSFHSAFRIQGQELHVTASIGISIFPNDGESIDTLLRYADIAMYYAKEKGRNNFQFYNPEINSRSLERMLFEGMLRQTIDRGELVVYYQPQVNIRNRRTVCAEALVRWKHPEQGILESKQFIPAAEDTGFITSIDEYVLRTVCVDIRSWLDAGLQPVYITVNLSAREFQNPDLTRNISRILEETGAPAEYLMIEITESLAMSNIERTIKRLNELVEMGVRVAIDDFGTGYSSLTHLKRLPVKKLKIDESFIRDITTDADDRTIINAVTQMAHTMKLEVTAEGVEQEGQFEFLKQLQCDEAQGYLFSAPLSPERFQELIAARK